MSKFIDVDSFRQNWLKNGKNEYVYDTNAFLESIDEQPTVDVVPVVHGEWEDVPNRYVCVAGDRPYHGNATSCSVCHDINPNAFKTNFCPNCGADMRRESEDEWKELTAKEKFVALGYNYKFNG